MGFGEEVPELGKEMDVDKRRVRNAQLLDFPPTKPNGSPDAMFQEFQRLTAVIDQRFSGIGKFYSPRIAEEQIDPKLQFQLPDLARQCGLRNMQLLSRASKMQLIRYRNGAADLPQLDPRIHDSIPLAPSTKTPATVNGQRGTSAAQ
jgi:hypothetical protein